MSRVPPGFEPDSKFLHVLAQAPLTTWRSSSHNANHIERSPRCASDLGITYDEDVLVIIDIFAQKWIPLPSVPSCSPSTRRSRTPIAGASTSLAITCYP